VQWGNYLCLYVALETEWDPSDGMFGFFDRLLKWLTAASLDELDPTGGPIHPPVTYATGRRPMFIPRANVPEVDGARWCGFAKIRDHGPYRRDIVGWCSTSEARAARADGFLVAPTILLTEDMPFEFPNQLLDVLLELIRRGVSKDLLFILMELANVLHDDEHVYVVVGTPMRGVVGRTKKQHLTVWRFLARDVPAIYETVAQTGDSDEAAVARNEAFSALLKWMVTNKIEVEWCPVREARPEVTRPRDEGSPMGRWAGARASLWGCGALGSHVAEHLVRAGVDSIVLHDNATVSPGVLVRQNFEDADIGVNKAAALAERLKRINPELVVDHFTTNLTHDLGLTWDDGSDVVFDLTASPAVALRLELSRQAHKSDATVVGMTIGHDAQHGLVVISPPSASGGPVDVRRKAKISASRQAGLTEFAEEFWPTDPARITMFQPEPGCSSPTFTGSNAQVGALAATMLLIAANVGTDDAMTAGLVALPRGVGEGRTVQIEFPNDIVVTDPINRHQIRAAPDALSEMRAWSRRAHRLAPKDETGGHLFGERDDALAVIWVSDVLGPPPDSEASPLGFVCGTEGVVEATRALHERSRGASRPIGMWHTHPDSDPTPSPTDHAGMSQIINDPDTSTPKQLLAILGGDPDAHTLGAYVYERGQPNGLPQQFFIARLSRPPATKHKVGVALSGGGFRAVAFHLGVLRALHDRGVLDRVEVISSVSGGSIISAMWAYGPDSFEEFDAQVIALLSRGLNGRIAAGTFLSYRLPQHLLGSALIAVTSAGRIAWNLARRGVRKGPTKSEPIFRRTVSLTTILERVLDPLLGHARIGVPTKDVHVIVNACDMRTGTAFRFGSTESGSTRYGTLVNNDVSVALAAATSAAYPVILPALDVDWEFQDRSGDRATHRVLLTDGGVFDNLGTSCLLPERNPAYSTNVHPVDLIISADAGPGALNSDTYPVWWPGRMKRAFESVYRKVQDGGKGSLFQHRSHGTLQGITMPFLGQNDDVLPIRPTDLVTRDQVVDYPTNFSKMKAQDIDLLTTRGEQLTRLMIEHHSPAIA
jgi:integrative and conjugative element protein (TIGR02256 family)